MEVMFIIFVAISGNPDPSPGPSNAVERAELLTLNVSFSNSFDSNFSMQFFPLSNTIDFDLRTLFCCLEKNKQ